MTPLSFPQLSFLEQIQVVSALNFDDARGRADDFAFTVVDDTGASSLTCQNRNDRPVHECRMVVAADSGVNSAEPPSGTAQPQFNLAVVDDLFTESNAALASFFIAPTTGDDLIPAADRIGWERIEPGNLNDYVEIGD